MRYDIHTNPPKISDSDIAKHQDFDALFAQFQALETPTEPLTQPETEPTTAEKIIPFKPQAQPSKRIFWWLGSAVAASVLGVWFWNSSPLANPNLEQALALNPPIEKLDKAFAHFSVDTERGDTVIQYGSGSRLKIPATAFIDKAGRPIKGKVDIQYREMHDHVDLFIAGVPQSAKQPLQVAGTLQVQGFQNGEEIFIGKGSALTVEMQTELPVQLPTESLAVYAYSAKGNTWEYQKADKTETLTNNSINPQNPNSQNPNPQPPTPNPQSPTSNAQIAEIRKKYPRPPKPQRLETAGSARETFDIEYDVNEFPELKDYQNITWASMDDSKAYKGTLTSREWESMEIHRKGEHRYVLVLEYDNERVVVEIAPVVKNSAEAEQIYTAQLAAWEKTITELDTKIAAEVAQLGNSSNPADSVATVVQNGLKKVVHRFEIQNFGLWACANTLAAGTARPLRFVDEKGSALALSELFVANPNQKTYFSQNLAANTNTAILENAPDNIVWAKASNGDWFLANNTLQTEPMQFQKMDARTEADLRRRLSLTSPDKNM